MAGIVQFAEITGADVRRAGEHDREARDRDRVNDGRYRRPLTAPRPGEKRDARGDAGRDLLRFRAFARASRRTRSRGSLRAGHDRAGRLLACLNAAICQHVRGFCQPVAIQHRPRCGWQRRPCFEARASIEGSRPRWLPGEAGVD